MSNIYNKTLKLIYKKILFLFSIFIFTISLLIISIQFYSNILIEKINQINNISEEIIKNQNYLKYESEFRILNSLFKEKTNNDIKQILFKINEKKNKDLETFKNLIINKAKEENWELVKYETINELNKNNLINFEIKIKPQDINNFYNFLINEGIYFKIKEMNIINEKDYIKIIIFIQ